ncbi:hypothetical protein MSPP1_000325 [Malassezia sp. CBS 17886]|nr:hypothetical protein MSPP1_000325 [Malassezia sp. CBS 17886]
MASGAPRGPKLRSPRKFRAVRSPQLGPVDAADARVLSPTELVVSTPPWTSHGRRAEGASRTEIYELVNDRYSGVSSTAPTAEEGANARAQRTRRRDARRRAAAKVEWEHMGLTGGARKRKSTSPYASEPSSAAASDSEGSSSAPNTRAGTRTRLASSRNSSPVPITGNGAVFDHGNAAGGAGVGGLAGAEASAHSVPVPVHMGPNAPVHPSPLARETVLHADEEETA